MSFVPKYPAIETFVNFANSEEADRWSDVLLVTTSSQGEETSKFQCHKIVLASHSHFLRQLLKDHEAIDDECCKIILPEVKPEDVLNSVLFMYKGQEICDQDFAKKTLRIGHPVPEDDDLEDVEDVRLSEELPIKKRRRKSPWVRRRIESTLEFAPFVIRDDEDDDDVPPVIAKRMKPKLKPSRKRSHESFECCDEKFEDILYYATHKEKVHYETPGENRFIVCCDEKLIGNYKVHLERSHKLDDSTGKAECCDITFQDFKDLTKHCSLNHGLRLSTYKQILCCATKLSNLEDYKRHKSDSDHVECNQCTFISKDERHLNLHLYVKHNIGDKPAAEESALKCKYCDKTFKRVQLRQEHEDKHDNKFKYSCDTCGKHFKLISSLRSHLYRMGKNHNPELREYQCDSCDKTFDTVIAKRKHTKVTHVVNKKAPKCKDCDKIFVDRHSLDNHIRVAHIKVKDVQCTFCGKLFATHDRMKVHERFVHVVKEEKVPCDICKKEFANKERMVDHRRSVHRERKYQCESCGSTFKNSSTLKSHVVSIHLEHDKKPLRCSICSKGFLHESRLKAHEAIHSDVAPFSCKFCGRPNKCKSNNSKHEKRCKKAMDKPPDEATSSTEPPQTTAT